MVAEGTETLVGAAVTASWGHGEGVSVIPGPRSGTINPVPLAMMAGLADRDRPMIGRNRSNYAWRHGIVPGSVDPSVYASVCNVLPGLDVPDGNALPLRPEPFEVLG